MSTDLMIGLILIGLACFALSVMYLVWSVCWGRPGGTFLGHLLAPFREKPRGGVIQRLGPDGWITVAHAADWEAALATVHALRLEDDKAHLYRWLED